MLDAFDVSAVALGLAGTGLGCHFFLRARRAEARVRRLAAELRTQRHAANHDPLTDLPNRRTFFRLGATLVAAPTPCPRIAVVLDVDNFKEINDRYGHAAGDHVLTTVARRLAFYAEDNLVARLGGDEFAALFVSRVDAAGRVYPSLEALAELVAEPLRFRGQDLSVTASIGRAEVTGTSLVQALHAADIAMYQAKRSGAVGLPRAAGQPRLEEGGQACPLPASTPVIGPPRTSPPPTVICRPTQSGSSGAARGDRASSRRPLAVPPL